MLSEGGGKRAAHITLGRRGEEIARQYLERRDYRVLHRNFSCPFGELDMVCVKDGVVIFIEVKTRRRSEAIYPEDSVGAAKRRRLVRCALFYLERHDLIHEPCRFDIVSVCLDPSAPGRRVRMIRDCIWEIT